MTISELGSLGELIAAVATLVTLAYLALQIRQSNRSHQLSAITRLSESSETWIGQIVQDSELLDLYLRALEAPETLSREERARFNLMLLQILRTAEGAWLQVEWGLIDSDYWSGFQEVMRVLVGSSAGRRAFDLNRRFLNPKFVAEVDRVLGGRERDSG